MGPVRDGREVGGCQGCTDAGHLAGSWYATRDGGRGEPVPNWRTVDNRGTTGRGLSRSRGEVAHTGPSIPPARGAGAQRVCSRLMHAGQFFPRELRQRQGWLQGSWEEGPPVCVPRLGSATTPVTSCRCFPLP